MVLMGTMLSTFATGMAAQGATDGFKAIRSARRMVKAIERKPLIDATSGTGRSLDHVTGNIEFRNVEFAYPARPDAKIYKNYSLKVARGQTVALVGASGRQEHGQSHCWSGSTTLLLAWSHWTGTTSRG